MLTSGLKQSYNGTFYMLHKTLGPIQVPPPPCTQYQLTHDGLFRPVRSGEPTAPAPV